MNATVSILYDVPLLATNDTKYFDVEWPPAPAYVKSRRLEESMDNTQIEDESTTSVVAMLKSLQQSQASMQQALQALKTHHQETLLQSVFISLCLSCVLLFFILGFRSDLMKYIKVQEAVEA